MGPLTCKHLRQQRLLRAGGGEALAQFGAQSAQGGYVGDDAGLLLTVRDAGAIQ